MVLENGLLGGLHSRLSICCRLFGTESWYVRRKISILEICSFALRADERHRILASTVAGLVPSVDTGEKGTNAQARIWREQCERTGLRLEDPYLRAMMSHLLADGWWDLLQEEQLLPLRDRLAIALSFLDDIHVGAFNSPKASSDVFVQLSSYLREVTGNLKKEGSLEGLLLTGLTDAGVDVLQSYVDSTGDVQTAAILATLVSPVTFKDVRVERWVGAYEDLLDKWSLFHFRCQFDIARGHLFDESVRDGEAVPFEWAERQLLVRCNYCNKVVNSQQPLEVPSHNSSAILEVVRVSHSGHSLANILVAHAIFGDSVELLPDL
jgi:hypothetical protein